MGVLKVMRVWQLTRSCVTLASLTLAVVTLSACEKQPPAQRPAVTLPVYQQGDVENGLVFTGEYIGKIKEILSVKEIFARLQAEIEAIN